MEGWEGWGNLKHLGYVQVDTRGGVGWQVRQSWWGRKRKMTKLSKLSKYLTTHHFEDILADMRSKGVKLDNKNKITGLRFFN